MPNWCSNNLNVWGDENELSEFKKHSLTPADHNSPEDFDFTFEGLYPTPKELMENSSPISKQESETDADFKSRVKRLEDEYGYNNWYEWRVYNWGTKWDASESVIMTNNNEEFYVGFDTAWAPPTNWLKKVSIRFPNLNFSLTYMEEGQGFCGKLRIGEGEIVEDEGVIEYTDQYGQLVEYREDGWFYTETNEKVEEEDFWPVSHNPFD
jgi:hypothetical protein